LNSILEVKLRQTVAVENNAPDTLIPGSYKFTRLVRGVKRDQRHFSTRNHIASRSRAFPEGASSKYVICPSSFGLLFSTELLLLVKFWMFVALTAASKLWSGKRSADKVSMLNSPR
jgi:hypothetical protein